MVSNNGYGGSGPKEWQDTLEGRAPLDDEDYPIVSTVPVRDDRLCFLLAGPFGAGKTKFLKSLQGLMPKVQTLWKYTTREEREFDPKGRSISEENFQQLLQDQEFAISYDFEFQRKGVKPRTVKYGVKRQEIDDAFRIGDVIMTSAYPHATDYLRKSQRRIGAPIVPILLTTPDPGDLEDRIKYRMADGEESKCRLEYFASQHRHYRNTMGDFYHVILNPTPAVLKGVDAADAEQMAMVQAEIDKGLSRLRNIIRFWQAEKPQLPRPRSKIHERYVNSIVRKMYGCSLKGLASAVEQARASGASQYVTFDKQEGTRQRVTNATNSSERVRSIYSSFYVTDVTLPEDNNGVARIQLNDSLFNIYGEFFKDFMVALTPGDVQMVDCRTYRYSLTDVKPSTDVPYAVEVRLG